LAWSEAGVPSKPVLASLGWEAGPRIFSVGKRDYSIAGNHADVTVRHRVTPKYSYQSHRLAASTVAN